MRKLYKSKENKILAGIIGGIGEYLNVDPVILRVVWIVIVVFTGFVPGIIVYLVAGFVVSDKPKEITSK
ncbi:MAG TPA: PspC domain-containing protein [Candidatus Nealsonbacteria bacterium]|uniref:Phage shock protein PspC N-terminal domain-containing protein n=1 Tax=marine sediment metagenome TaxID=412755 RepID=A0A0F9VSC5_9ZZZZ|nr:PspC domain-containing protein [Candidatus Nealsonbacteria bacterium]HEB46520.1 PspC domain-containing protein [Candidatus Nealsonbacteria bacterium]